MDDDDIKEEGNGSIADSGGAGAVDESGNVDMEDSLNLDGCDSTIEAAANKGKKDRLTFCYSRIKIPDSTLGTQPPFLLINA